MKTVKPGFQVIQEPNLSLKIERIARVCYKSEDKICEGSDERMIRSLVKRKHMAMLEHGSVCVKVPWSIFEDVRYVKQWMEQHIEWVDDYSYPEAEEEGAQKERSLQNSFIRMTANHVVPDTDDDLNHFLVSGNLRAWIDLFMAWKDCLRQTYEGRRIGVSAELLHLVSGMCPAAFEEVNRVYENSDRLDTDETGKCVVITDYSTLTSEERMIHEDVSVLFTCDRGVTHELVRHRPASFAQESTRYCNYSLDKNDNQVTFILPYFYNELGREDEFNVWKSAMEDAEKYYLGLIERGSQPQEARSVLPHSTKVDIVVTANLMEWKHIFELRACEMTGKAHPQMREVMCPCFRDMREQYHFAFGDLILPEEIMK